MLTGQLVIQDNKNMHPLFYKLNNKDNVIFKRFIGRLAEMDYCNDLENRRP